MKLVNELKGDQRSLKAGKNIIASVTFKGVDTFVFLALVPLTLGYLNPYEYGIWLTLNSILTWINSFDIGLGNGLRNKLGEALAIGDNKLAKAYVSTTFFMLILLMLAIILIGFFASFFIDWYTILGASETQVSGLNKIVLFAFIIFCLRFVFQFVGNVYFALQLPAVNNAITTTANILSLTIIYILTRYTSGNLFFVVITFTCSPLLIFLIAYPITFRSRYKYLAPTLSSFKKEYLEKLLGLGFVFFIMQIAGLILFTMSNLLISNWFGPENVTPFNIVFKYFSLITVAMTLVITPIWSSTTDAFAKNDLEWIKNTVKRLKRILLLLAMCLFVMVCLSKTFYKVWVGNSIEVDFSMTVLMSIYTFILMWSLSFSNILNGMGVLKIQMINTVAMSVIFIPISYFFTRYFSINGILLGMCCVNGFNAVINSIQLHRILKGKAIGLWSK